MLRAAIDGVYVGIACSPGRRRLRLLSPAGRYCGGGGGAWLGMGGWRRSRQGWVKQVGWMVLVRGRVAAPALWGGWLLAPRRGGRRVRLRPTLTPTCEHRDPFRVSSGPASVGCRSPAVS